MQDEEPRIIPTSYKAKIPRALSYSCGAKTLSVAWQDVPQFGAFDLQFPCDVSREFHTFSGVRNVLQIHRSKWHFTQSSRFWEQRESGEMWNITVRVCRREDVHEVRGWLHETGLELARLWLTNEVPLYRKSFWGATWDEDSREFDVRHD